MEINVFNVIKAIQSGAINKDNIVPDSTTGRVTELSPLKRKFLEAISKTSPEFAKKIAKKMMRVDFEKLTKFWHEHKESSGVDPVTAKESYKVWTEIGAMSSEVPPNKITEGVRNAGKILDTKVDKS